MTLPEPSAEASRAAAARQDRLTKPRGSLGRLESLVVRLAGIQDRELPTARPAFALLFAADHPVTKHGVSAYPAEVTAAMLANFAGGGAAASVACRHLTIDLRVFDVGVNGTKSIAAPNAGVFHRVSATASASVFALAERVDAGDLRRESALSPDALERCLQAGADAVRNLENPRVVILGEMGIGNTTAAATLAASLLGGNASDFVGAGTGISAEQLRQKRSVVADALARVSPTSPREALREFGGREIAAMVGAAREAAARRAVILVDGYIVSAAMLALCRMVPEVRSSLVFAHRSREPGHQAVLRALNAAPLLDLDFALWEGTGALAAFPLLEQACVWHAEMATFDEAGVPDR
ncbi:MAG: nicotinate-nucleotide--dimethylbenzimidazole phosphoribosyltransferase [Myxococcota bacterium]